MSKTILNSFTNKLIVVNQFLYSAVHEYYTPNKLVLKRMNLTNNTIENNYLTLNTGDTYSYGQMCSDGIYIYIPTYAPVSKIFRVDTRDGTVTEWKTYTGSVMIIGSCIIGNLMYVTMPASSTIRTINLTTIVETTITSLEYPGALTTDGTYLYINFWNNVKYPTSGPGGKRRSICRLTLSNNNKVLDWLEPNYFDGPNSGCELINFGDFIYVAFGYSDRIIQVNKTTKVTNDNYSTNFGSEGPQSFCTDGTFGYVSNSVVNGNNTYKLTLESTSAPPAPTGLSYNPTTKLLTWTGTAPFDSFIIQDLTKGLDVTSIDQSYNLTSFLSSNPSVMTLNVTVKQVSSGLTGIASSSLTINLPPPAPTALSYNTTTKVLTWIGTSPFNSFIIQDLTKGLDVTSTSQSFNLTSFLSLNPSIPSLNITVKQVSSGITGPASSSLFSEICFPKDTPITTDQGIIPIQEIRNQTINGSKVEHITQIVGTFKHLVCFEKDALYPGCPSERTIMTRNHKVSYNGDMVEAGTLLNEHIYLIPYNGEILYNVLLKENGTMYVNNMLCETLDTNNIIAHFYRSNYNPEEKRKITDILNDFHGTPYYDKVAGLFFEDHYDLDNRLKLEM